MASRFPQGISRRDFMGGMIGAVALSSFPARGLGMLADPGTPFAPHQFPKDFLWGAAIASYQIEGAWKEEFLRGYVSAHARSMNDGANIRAYHCWSLLDNFEWAEGYTQRFGIVYVDFRDQRRIVKEPGRWYAKPASTGKLT